MLLMVYMILMVPLTYLLQPKDFSQEMSLPEDKHEGGSASKVIEPKRNTCKCMTLNAEEEENRNGIDKV